jgi:hypothetical protein
LMDYSVLPWYWTSSLVDMKTEILMRIFSRCAKFVEKKIYGEAKSRGLIDGALHAEIIALYDFRNDTIHKFFLTDLRYFDLPPLLDRYQKVYDQCYAIVDRLEERQIREGKGMPKPGPKADPNEILAAVKLKFGTSPVP